MFGGSRAASFRFSRVAATNARPRTEFAIT